MYSLLLAFNVQNIYCIIQLWHLSLPSSIHPTSSLTSAWPPLPCSCTQMPPNPSLLEWTPWMLPSMWYFRNKKTQPHLWGTKSCWPSIGLWRNDFTGNRAAVTQSRSGWITKTSSPSSRPDNITLDRHGGLSSLNNLTSTSPTIYLPTWAWTTPHISSACPQSPPHHRPHSARTCRLGIAKPSSLNLPCQDPLDDSMSLPAFNQTPWPGAFLSPRWSPRSTPDTPVPSGLPHFNSSSSHHLSSVSYHPHPILLLALSTVVPHTACVESWTLIPDAGKRSTVGGVRSWGRLLGPRPLHPWSWTNPGLPSLGILAPWMVSWWSWKGVLSHTALTWLPIGPERSWL